MVSWVYRLLWHAIEYLLLIVKSKTRSCILFLASFPSWEINHAFESCDVTCSVRIHGANYLKVVSHKNVGLPSCAYEHAYLLFGRLWNSLFSCQAIFMGLQLLYQHTHQVLVFACSFPIKGMNSESEFISKAGSFLCIFVCNKRNELRIWVNQRQYVSWVMSWNLFPLLIWKIKCSVLFP